MSFAIAASVASIAGAGMSALGQLSAGQAASNQASYQAQVARNNQVVAEQNAAYSIAAGSARAERTGRQAASTLGKVKATIAANNLDVNSGSSLAVQESQRETGALDQLTEENNALLQAYGYRAAGSGYAAEAGLKDYAASAAGPASFLSAGGGLLSSASLLPDKFKALGNLFGNSAAPSNSDLQSWGVQSGPDNPFFTTP